MERQETWSVVIPALSEAANIGATVASALAGGSPPCEVLVVDGGSSDGTQQAARKAGAKVIRAPRGRGSQLNAGWRRAKGDWVLFLHADSQLPPGYNALLQQQLAAAARQQQRPWWQPFGGGQQQAAAERERALAWGAGACGAQCQSEQRQPRRPWWLLGGDGSVGSSGTCKCGGGSGSPQCSGDMCSSRGSGAGACAPPAWGCFSSIRATELNPLHAWLLQAGVALRTRALHRPYGDQALFVRRRCLEQLQGVKDWPLLEDLELVQRLNKCAGPPLIVPAAVTTSGRRWARLGFWRAWATNQAVLAGYAAGVDVHELARLYSGGGGVKPGAV